jgi:hypothetical protein
MNAIRSHRLGRLALLGCVALVLLAGLSCESSHQARSEQAPDSEASHGADAPAQDASAAGRAVRRNPSKDAYFGDLHVHTSWSLDAFAFGVRVGPEDAYRYARGGAIDHVSGEKIQMKGPPLDFIAVTEHANYLGISTAAQDPRSPVREIPLIRDLLDSDRKVQGAAMADVLTHLSRDTFMPALAPDAVVASTWQRLVVLADRHTVPGEFTAFVGYEYTSMPDGQNLHRNVIFRGSDVPALPFSTFDSQNPEDLWAWMEKARASGSDVLAIPHNGNGSNGLMYERVDRSGRPIDASYAELRLRNEPVSEVIQIKGQSETHPALSPNDEWAGFEILDTILGRPTEKSRPQGSYARRALMDGLEMEEAAGANPYRFGMIGSSDGHNASSPVEEDNFTGKIGLLDGSPEARLASAPTGDSGLELGERRGGSPFSAAGLAGVWAEANTREDLFDSLRAREVFATSGPRIAVRFFGGWELSSADLEAGIVQAGRARGVPMGGELAAASGTTRAPTFLVHALRDPREAPLERLQIVKAWVHEGRARERVYDVACANGVAPDPASQRCALVSEPPDLSDCRYDPSRGRAELSAAWTDEDFEVDQRALYYARVLQIPTCRWSTYDANRLGVERPPGAAAWLQERAVTSPIWVTPTLSTARASAGRK